MNDGARGVNLSEEEMFAVAGYVSTKDPASGNTDSAIRIKPVNFDYSAGEKLIVWWLGKCTKEGSIARFMGDGVAPGWVVLATASGAMQLMLNGAGYGVTSTATPFDGNLRSWATVIDGQAKKHCTWVDETVDISFPDGYRVLSGGAAYETKTSNTVNIGTASPAPGDTFGIATATRALAILRLPAQYSTPAIEIFTAVFQQLRANPSKLILASAF